MFTRVFAKLDEIVRRGTALKPSYVRGRYHLAGAALATADNFYGYFQHDEGVVSAVKRVSLSQQCKAILGAHGMSTMSTADLP